MKLYPDFDGSSRVVGQLSEPICSQALRFCVRRQTSQTLSIKPTPIRMCTDIQPHTVMQMKWLQCLVLLCCISKFAVLNRLLLFLASDLNPITTKKLQSIYDFKTTTRSCVVSICWGFIQCSALPKSKVYRFAQDNITKLAEQNMIQDQPPTIWHLLLHPMLLLDHAKLVTALATEIGGVVYYPQCSNDTSDHSDK